MDCDVMNWTQFILFFIGVFGLFIWNRTESRNDMRLVLSLLDGIQKEMKDFHGKLERQDADFKSHLLHLHEERRK
jgi:hypothetical protein